MKNNFSKSILDSNKSYDKTCEDIEGDFCQKCSKIDNEIFKCEKCKAFIY